MKGDFTRSTFRQINHYNGVRLQQGRVHLDADFNEQVDISAHRDRTTTLDVVGASGAPDLGGGFRISAATRLNGIGVFEGVGRAVGNRGTVLASMQGDDAWERQKGTEPPADQDLLAVEVIDERHAFAVGTDGTILAQTDGTNWEPQTAANVEGKALRGLHFLDSDYGWAVGDGGLVVGTADAGATWAKPFDLPGGVTQTLRSIHFADATHGWAVGDSGRILATEDGGATWIVQTPPAGFTSNLHAVHFVDEERGWAVGDGAAILSTTDGGSTWIQRSPGPGIAATLRSLDAEGSSVVWAAGDRGTVLRSTDGGVSWLAVSVEETLDDIDLTAIRVFGVAGALIAGDHSTVARVSMEDGIAKWQVLPTPDKARDLTISAGRIYVGGVVCENEGRVRYLNQPHLPGATFPRAGAYLAYLDVWSRHLTALDRSELREVALGGPDTATRTQTVWQVRIDPAPVPSGSVCADLPEDWQPDEASGTGYLRARSSPTPFRVSDCMVPAGGGYRRLENQLYRVEIHAAGSGAMYKWSRENGSVVARLETTDPAPTTKTVTISDPERDAVGGFAGAEWIELSDDRRVLEGEPGVLLRVQGVTGKVIKTETPPPAASQFGPGATVRRWDGAGAVVTGGWHALAIEDGATGDDGIEIEFGGGTYRTGDYWTIPARTLTGDIEWPRQEGAPSFIPPEGVEHRFCPLALVVVDDTGNVEVTDDCRPLFSPLVAQTHLHPAGGDGQEVMPPPGGGLAKLPAPLEVAVVNGRRALSGATVRFTVAGTADRVGTAGVTTYTTTTSNGIAACEWWLSTNTATHQVSAQLLGDDGQAIGPVLHFNAGFSVAAKVGYVPGCRELVGATTVQDAIDKLCDLRDDIDYGVHVSSIRLVSPSIDLNNDDEVSVTSLSKGLRILCDEALDAATITRATCYVIVEQPFPASSKSEKMGVVGYQPLVLAANIDAGAESVLWMPSEEAGNWLENLLEPPDRLLCRLILKGNFIMSENRARYLDGESFLTSTPRSSTTRLPSGDGRPGGDFEMWFWLTPPVPVD